LFGLGIAWSAVRAFDGRSTPLSVVLAGGAFWLLACTWPPFLNLVPYLLPYRIMLQAAISAAYVFAAGWEFGRANAHALKSRHALAVACTVQGCVALLRGVYSAFFVHQTSMFDGKGSVLQGLLVAEPVLMLIVIGILAVGLVREEA